MKKILILTTILLLTGLLSACSQISNSDAAVAAVETYFTALVEKDQDGLVNSSCAAWEANAINESMAYFGVETRLEGIACSFVETDGEFSIVSCEGNIIATYSGEDVPLALNIRQYLSIEEGGEWRMCGYR